MNIHKTWSEWLLNVLNQMTIQEHVSTSNSNLIEAGDKERNEIRLKPLELEKNTSKEMRK